MSKTVDKCMFWRRKNAEDEERGGIDWNDFPQNVDWSNPNETRASSEARTPTTEREAVVEGAAADFLQQVTWPILAEARDSLSGETPSATRPDASEREAVANEEKLALVEGADADSFFAGDFSSPDLERIPGGRQDLEPEFNLIRPGAYAVGTFAGHVDEHTLAESITDSTLPLAVSAQLAVDRDEENRRLRSLFNLVLSERANAPLAVLVVDDTSANRNASGSENGALWWSSKRRRLCALGMVIILTTAIVVAVVN
jgi:hypothetical protein